MLQQRNFLLKLFRELIELVFSENILLFTRANSFSLVVVEASTLILRHNLGRVIEKDSC